MSAGESEASDASTRSGRAPPPLVARYVNGRAVGSGASLPTRSCTPTSFSEAPPISQGGETHLRSCAETTAVTVASTPPKVTATAVASSPSPCIQTGVPPVLGPSRADRSTSCGAAGGAAAGAPKLTLATLSASDPVSDADGDDGASDR